MEETTNAERLIAYDFANRDLLKQALIAAGSREVKNIDLHHDGANKGLAMVGDALIRLILVDEWYSGQETRGRNNVRASSWRMGADSCQQQNAKRRFKNSLATNTSALRATEPTSTLTYSRT